MARQKYLLKKVSFGKKGDLAREIAESIIKKVGKTGFSKEVRNALIAYFSTNKEFNQVKIKQLLYERKELKKKIPEISKQLILNEKDLNKLGYKLDELE